MYIGVDIGGTKCSVVKGNEEKGIVGKIKFPTTSFKETFKNITDAIEKMGKAKAIGISCGGPLDTKKGVILSPPNLPGWDNINIFQILKEKFEIPVAI